MLKAKDIMTREVITLSPETDVIEAARLLLAKKINGAPVVRDGKLIGVLSQTDLVAQQKSLKLPSLFTILDGILPFSSMEDVDREMEKISALNVEHAMSKNPVTVGPETSIEDVAGIMVDQKMHTIPVVDGGELVGVIGKEDILRTLMGGKA